MTARTDAAALSKDARRVFDQYVRLLEPVPGPISVWATTDEGLLHLHTLISADEDVERAVYGAETSLVRAVDPVRVDFDVYTRAETVHEYLFKNIPPLFSRN